MLSTLPNLSHSIFQGTNYAPQVSSPLSSSPLRSSPLSPRDGNVPTRRFPMSSPTPTGKQQSEFSKRKVKSNPLIHNRNDGREARRNLFLRKVRESSEDRRWEARGGDDEMMRTIWLAEERRRVEHQQLEAALVPFSQEEEPEQEQEDVESHPSNSKSQDEEMADEVAQQEEAELDNALLAMMEQNVGNLPDTHETLETPYGSDDEEYDSWFMEVINATDQGGMEAEVTQPIRDADQEGMDTAMDMS